MERLLWTKGLIQLLDVDGAYVATTDTRPMLREISKKLGISVLDGADIKRMSDSDRVIYHDRISEEDSLRAIVSVDRMRRGKDLQLQYHDVEFALIDNFGAKTLNRALDSFGFFAGAAVTAHPGSEAAGIALRLSYFAAAVAALALDYISSEVSFRAANERRTALTNAIRFGDIDEIIGTERIRLAVALIKKYAAGGDSAARTVELGIKNDLNNIPAEIVAEHIVKNTKNDDLFQIAIRLEHLVFSRNATPFDVLNAEDKGFVGMLADYSGIDRVRYASSLNTETGLRSTSTIENTDDGSLFESISKNQGSKRS